MSYPRSQRKSQEVVPAKTHVYSISGSDCPAAARSVMSSRSWKVVVCPRRSRDLPSYRLQLDALIAGAGESEPLSVAATRYDCMRLWKDAPGTTYRDSTPGCKTGKPV